MNNWISTFLLSYILASLVPRLPLVEGLGTTLATDQLAIMRPSNEHVQISTINTLAYMCC